jgi:hypothetical protein
MPVKTLRSTLGHERSRMAGIQEGMGPCYLSRRRRDGLREDDQNTRM